MERFDFQQLFEKIPGLYLALTPDMKIAAATDAYLRATLTERDKIIGQNLFDVFPNNPNDPDATGVTNLHAMLQRVIKNKTAEKIPVQKYDIPRPEKYGGGFEERYWSLCTTPVLNKKKAVQYLVHQVEDVTDLIRLQHQEAETKAFNEQLRREIEERKQTEDALRLSEQKFRLLVESLPIGVWLLDNRGNVLYGNKSAQDIWAGDDFIGPVEYSQIQAWWLDSGKWVKPHEWAPVKVLKTRKKVVGDEVKIQKFNGEFAKIINSAFPLFDENNQIIGVLVTNQDITEEKHLEHEREVALQALNKEKRWLQTIFEGAPIGIVIIRAEEPEIAIPNQEARQMYDSEVDWELGTTSYIGKIFDARGKRITKDQLPSARVLRGETVKGEEYTFRFPDGHEIPLFVVGGAIDDETGQRLGAVTFFQDISPLKEAQRFREEWSAIIAHDLRQPITTLQLAAELLKSSGEASQKALDLAKMIESGAKQIGRMTNDLLEVSQLEAHKLRLELEETDVVWLLEQIVDKYKRLAPKTTITLNTSGQISKINVDRDRFEQIIGNLISNAAKYSFPETEVLIRATQADLCLRISVMNKGIGIDPSDMENLFQRFHRTRRAKEKGIKGIGLGLYITKGLVEAHGGQIYARSEPGKTTTFCIELPYIRKSKARNGKRVERANH